MVFNIDLLSMSWAGRQCRLLPACLLPKSRSFLSTLFFYYVPSRIFIQWLRGKKDA